MPDAADRYCDGEPRPGVVQQACGLPDGTLTMVEREGGVLRFYVWRTELHCASCRCGSWEEAGATNVP